MLKMLIVHYYEVRDCWGQDSSEKGHGSWAWAADLPCCKNRVAEGLGREQAEWVCLSAWREQSNQHLGQPHEEAAPHLRFQHALVHMLHKGCKLTTHDPYPATVIFSWSTYCFWNFTEESQFLLSLEKLKVLAALKHCIATVSWSWGAATPFKHGTLTLFPHNSHHSDAQLVSPVCMPACSL